MKTLYGIFMILAELMVLVSLLISYPDHLLYGIFFLGWAIIFKLDYNKED